jgi:hypothetical protein
MARKRVSGVSRKAPFLPSKHAHALSPLGADFHPPFFCFDGYGLTLNPSGNKRLVKFIPKSTFLHPYHLSGRELEVLHLCIESIGWPQMCNSGKGHQFPFLGGAWLSCLSVHVCCASIVYVRLQGLALLLCCLQVLHFARNNLRLWSWSQRNANVLCAVCVCCLSSCCCWCSWEQQHTEQHAQDAHLLALCSSLQTVSAAFFFRLLMCQQD